MKHYIKNFNNFVLNEQQMPGSVVAAKKLYDKLDPDIKKLIKTVVDPLDVSGKLKDNKEEIKKKLKAAAETAAKVAKKVVDPLELYKDGWNYIKTLF